LPFSTGFKHHDHPLNRCEVLNLLLESIAFEELGLAHLINAEAEKIQYATNYSNIDIECLLKVNQSARKMLRDIIKKEMILQLKLEDILQETVVDGYDDCDK
jgi:hypothetical protein